MDFIKCLEECIEETGVDLKTLAAQTGICYSTLCRNLKGDRLPNLNFVLRICAYFGKSLEEMEVYSLLPPSELEKIKRLGMEQTGYVVDAPNIQPLVIERHNKQK